MMTNPSNKIDYERAGLLEQAVRDAARRYGFFILKIEIEHDERSGNPPEITATLEQGKRPVVTP